MTADTADELDEGVDNLLEDASPDAPVDILDRLRERVYFAGDQLRVDDPDLIATRLVRERWSPSSALSLNDDSCAAKWAIEKLLPRSANPSGAAEQGTAGHWVLETLFGLPGRERTIQQAMRILDGITPERNPDLALPATEPELYMWRAEVLGKILGLWHTEDPTTVFAVGRETRLDTVSVAGVPFIGIVDRTQMMTVGGRTGLKIDDFKTGVFPATRAKALHHADQARLYHLAYTDLHGEDPVGGTIIYTAHGKVSDIDMSRTELNRVAASFVETFDQANRYASTGAYPTALGMLCGWCPFTTVCPTARLGGRSKAKNMGAEAGTEIGIRFVPQAPAALMIADPDLDLDRMPPDDAFAPEPPPDTAPEPDVDTLIPPDDPWADWPREEVQGPTSVGVEANQEEVMSQAVATGDTATRPAQPMWSGAESKNWETFNPDQTPNPESKAAGGVFGVMDMAILQLQKAGVQMTLASAKAVSQTLMVIVDRAQREITRTGTANLGDGLNTRLRGVLYSHIESHPMPFGQPVEVWDEWATKAVTRLRSVGRLGYMLMTESLPEQPWAGPGSDLLHQPVLTIANAS